MPTTVETGRNGQEAAGLLEPSNWQQREEAHLRQRDSSGRRGSSAGWTCGERRRRAPIRCRYLQIGRVENSCSLDRVEQPTELRDRIREDAACLQLSQKSAQEGGSPAH